jgi:hypothetical protein
MLAIFMTIKLLGDLRGKCAIKPFTINHVENRLAHCGGQKPQ